MLAFIVDSHRLGDARFFGGIVALWIFSAAVSAMCPPVSSSGEKYRWLYRFAHLLAANLDRAGLLDTISTEPVESIPLK